MKRILDVAIAGAALALSGPAVLLLAAAVKLDSPGPAFYVQSRVGRGGRPIRIPKLRTMVADAAKAGPLITSADDRRITRVGRYLRKTKLDELPQLWSVLRGDMSLVGPRPEVRKYVDVYKPEWKPLLEQRPGLTDVASITFRDEEALLASARDRERAYVEVIMPLKLELALRGLQSTVWGDLKLLARTVAVALRLDHASDDEILRHAKQQIELLNRQIP